MVSQFLSLASSAFISRLNELFPGTALYRETVPAQNLRFPYFFVQHLSSSVKPERRNCFLAQFDFTIRYYASSDLLIRTDLQEHLDSAAFSLLSGLDHILWEQFPVRIIKPRVEKKDGVLHWFGSFRVLLRILPEPEPMQRQLDVFMLHGNT